MSSYDSSQTKRKSNFRKPKSNKSKYRFKRPRDLGPIDIKRIRELDARKVRASIRGAMAAIWNIPYDLKLAIDIYRPKAREWHWRPEYKPKSSPPTSIDLKDLLCINGNLKKPKPLYILPELRDKAIGTVDRFRRNALDYTSIESRLIMANWVYRGNTFHGNRSTGASTSSSNKLWQELSLHIELYKEISEIFSAVTKLTTGLYGIELHSDGNFDGTRIDLFTARTSEHFRFYQPVTGRYEQEYIEKKDVNSISYCGLEIKPEKLINKDKLDRCSDYFRLKGRVRLSRGKGGILEHEDMDKTMAEIYFQVFRYMIRGSLPYSILYNGDQYTVLQLKEGTEENQLYISRTYDPSTVNQDPSILSMLLALTWHTATERLRFKDGVEGLIAVSRVPFPQPPQK